jgi:L-ascorbate metabolism protein UlaG (beta-lactamase superfamily)
MMRVLTTTIAAVLSIVTVLVAPTATAQGKTQVQWLGQSAFKVTSPGGKVIVIDPWLTTNPKTPDEFKKLEALGKVDLILVTHAHADHFTDAAALAKLNNAPVYGPGGLASSMMALGILPKELAPSMNKSGTVTPIGPDIKITVTRAEHSSELTWKNPGTGNNEIHVGGEPIGFIVELENGFRIYHMGDTGLFGDMKLIGDYYKPDLVLIPIGGHFTMGPKDAAYATSQWLKAKFAIPMHYGTFGLLKGTPAEYTDALKKAKTRVLALNPGDKHEF